MAALLQLRHLPALRLIAHGQGQTLLAGQRHLPPMAQQHPLGRKLEQQGCSSWSPAASYSASFSGVLRVAAVLGMMYQIALQLLLQARAEAVVQAGLVRLAGSQSWLGSWKQHALGTDPLPVLSPEVGS